MKDDGTDAAKQPTKAGIEAAIKKLVADTQSGDVIFLFFAGHCEVETASEGGDETHDQGICPSDNGLILDDQLNEWILKDLEKRNDITNVRVYAMVRISVS